jgi:hypothetical protein
MASDVSSEVQQFHWEVQPAGAVLIAGLVEDFCERSPRLAGFRERLRNQTGTRLTDWIDHLVIPSDEPLAEDLPHAGFERGEDGGDGLVTWEHDEGLFPRVRVGARGRQMVIKVDSLDDFMSAIGRAMDDTLPLHWPPAGPVRQVAALVERGVELCAIERHGSRAFHAPPADPEQLELAEQHLKSFCTRARKVDDSHDGFADATRRIKAAAKDLGTGWACDLFFRAEREYWQSRNYAARVQYRRQQRLGLGWANHDHHTFRSGRQCFSHLIEVLELLGFVCRERFYAGREAGWGAQVLEQLDSGVVIFADVDLSPAEVTGDFAHEPLPQRAELGTVGLWCRLHGEAFLAAGMHHLECQFDFDAVRKQLSDEGIQTMAPFTNFPFLKQAFTAGEVWPVEPARIDSLLGEGLIDATQAEKFRREGALGSHLEILERNDGYKGFNQTGINDIILRTDPRR